MTDGYGSTWANDCDPGHADRDQEVTEADAEALAAGQVWVPDSRQCAANGCRYCQADLAGEPRPAPYPLSETETDAAGYAFPGDTADSADDAGPLRRQLHHVLIATAPGGARWQLANDLAGMIAEGCSPAEARARLADFLRGVA